MRIYFGDPRVEVDIPDEVATKLGVWEVLAKRKEADYEATRSAYHEAILEIGKAYHGHYLHGFRDGRIALAAEVAAMSVKP